MCAELQHSVSGLDCRLAELLHWEMEARELYQVLRSSERQRQQRGQDPQATVGWSTEWKLLSISYHNSCFLAHTNVYSTHLIPVAPDFAGSTAGGPGCDGGAGLAGDGNDQSEELAHPVPPCFRHAGQSPGCCRPITGRSQFTYCLG